MCSLYDSTCLAELVTLHKGDRQCARTNMGTDRWA